VTAAWLRVLALCLVAAVAELAIANTATAAVQTLQDAVRGAMTRNPKIGIATGNREALDEGLRQARALYLPQVDVAVGYGREHSNDLSTRRRLGAGTNAGSVNLDRGEGTVTLVQRVFDGFETRNEVARQRHLVESAARRVYETAEFLALDAGETYLDVARQRELRRLAEENVQMHLDILQSLRLRLAGGGGSAADVAQTEARLARSRATLAQTHNDMRDAEALFLRIVGETADILVRPRVEAAILPASADSAVGAAVRANPTIAIFDADLKAAERDIAVADSRFFPRINLEAEGSYYDNRDAIESWERGAQVMLRARWNLYRGGADLGHRREALARRAEAQSRRQNAEIEAQEQARRAWNGLQASRERAQLLGTAVRFSAETRDAYRQQFNVAQRSLLDVLDAENELFVAKGQFATAEYSSLAASYRLLAVTGMLMPALGADPPPAADPTPRGFVRDLLR
jgi:adhesin transport system outer membrane protein